MSGAVLNYNPNVNAEANAISLVNATLSMSTLPEAAPEITAPLRQEQWH